MYFRRFVTFILAFIVFTMSLFGLTTGMATADEVDRPVTIVVADSAAVRQDAEWISYTRSFVHMMATLQPERRIVFVDTDSPSEYIGPFTFGAPDFNNRLDQIEEKLHQLPSVFPETIVEAVVEARANLASLEAPHGSDIYIIGGDSNDISQSEIYQTLSPTLETIAAWGWAIHGVGLPNTSGAAREFLQDISGATGGRVFSLTLPDGFQIIANALLAEGGDGSLVPISEYAQTGSTLFRTGFSIAPGTRETNLLFFKDSPTGSLRLRYPSGLEVSTRSSMASYFMETPTLVIWKLAEPTPGQWQIDARNINGALSLFHHTTNRYNAVLKAPSPIVVNKVQTISAYIRDGQQQVVLNDVRLQATILSPDGVSRIMEMDDDGTGGDAVAGDGLYALTLPPVSSGGTYKIALEIVWDEFNHSVTSDWTLEAQVFPRIAIEPVKVEALELGEQVQVATVSVHVDEEPYPIDPDHITPMSATPNGETLDLQVKPRRLYGDGPAWEYDVFITPDVRGTYAVQFRMDMSYAGQAYSDTSDVIMAVTALPPPVPVIVPALTDSADSLNAEEVATVPVAIAPRLDPQNEMELPRMLLMIPVILILIIGIVAVYLRTRTTPYGYIYNDNQEPIVDFATLQRGRIARLLRTGLVRGSELNVPGLEGVVFQFDGSRINIRSSHEHPTVRVNNQPLVDKTDLEDKSWIGTGGKLYTFLANPIQLGDLVGAD